MLKMEDKDREEVKEKKQVIRGKRSPNYPNINLQKAIAMISDFYDKFKRHAVPAPLAMEAMGYSITSGQAQSMLASLSYYDLVQVERGALLTKKVNITAKGFTILKNPNAAEKSKAIQEAALSPAIFKKLYLKFPNQFPQESLLAWELETTYGFNPNTIPSVIAVFKQTIDYARIYESGIIEEEKDASEYQEQDEMEGKDMAESEGMTLKTKLASQYSYTPPLNAGKEKEIANYPIRGGTIRLLASGPVTQKAIDKLIKMLELSKEEFPENDQHDISKTGDEQS